MHKASASSASVARPDDKMGRPKRSWYQYIDHERGPYPTSTQRKGQQKNAKRRRRDRQVED